MLLLKSELVRRPFCAATQEILRRVKQNEHVTSRAQLIRNGYSCRCGTSFAAMYSELQI